LSLCKTILSENTSAIVNCADTIVVNRQSNTVKRNFGTGGNICRRSFVTQFSLYTTAGIMCYPETFGLPAKGFGFRVQGFGFKLQGSRFRAQGSGFKVSGSGFRGSRVQGFQVQGDYL
jgi:hypothetical protein